MFCSKQAAFFREVAERDPPKKRVKEGWIISGRCSLRSRGSYVSQTDNNNDHHANGDSRNDAAANTHDNDSHNDDDVNTHDDSHNDDEDGTDESHSHSLNSSLNTIRCHESLSDGSDRAAGHDDKFDGFDEIVRAQLLGSSAPSRRTSGCSKNRNLLG